MICHRVSTPPLPVTAEKVILFVAFLGTQGLSPSTIESYLAGLRHARLLTDPSHMSPSFHTPYVKLLLQGIARSSAHPTRARLPITQSIMNRIKSILAQEPQAYANLMLWAACCVGFFGFLRCSEFLIPDGTTFDPEVHLAVNDLTYVTSVDPPHVELRIKASKTDQLRRGEGKCAQWQLCLIISTLVEGPQDPFSYYKQAVHSLGPLL